MNIFVTSPCPVECASYLDDKRVVKMILETAQILSTLLDGPYRPTHRNHPVVLWAAVHENLSWLVRHGLALCAEYSARYPGRTHKSEAVIRQLAELVGHTEEPPSSWANCTPHKDLPVFEAYRRTLDEKWAADKRLPTRYGIPTRRDI